MAKFIEGEYRKSTGYLRGRLSNRKVQGLNTSREIDDELWSILDFYSEIDSFGLEFIKNLGIKNSLIQKRLHKHFQAHIRQAKGYYYSAKVLPIRSSPLLYYYSFMNLAMAILVIQQPSIIEKKLSHGLSYNLKTILPFKKQSINVFSKGVFPMLYNWYFNHNLTIKHLNISSLFNYCTDIMYECQVAGIQETKILSCKYSQCVNEVSKTAWPLLAISSANEILNYPKTFKNFISYFEKVDLDQLNFKEIFDISTIEKKNFNFFQGPTKQWSSDNLPPFHEVNQEILKILKNVLQFNYFKKDYDLIIALPYKRNKQVQLDETLAIYLIMFYLSCIVRYRPDFMEQLLNKKEAWLIDSFIKSCSITFLRSMISRIIGIEYILDRR